MNIGLVGATNVGKSTLFNRLIWQFRAIVTDIPGTTTDIVNHTYHGQEQGDMVFSDSPGLGDFDDEFIYVKKIIDTSDLILFVIDDNIGITAKEEAIFWYIMDTGKKKQTILVVNKLDINRKELDYEIAVADYYTMGFETIIGISARNENNIGALWKEIHHFARITKQRKPAKQWPQSIPLAIVGKPNAGKSTLINTLLGENVSKVSPVPGTTRDYITASFTYERQLFSVYDTAGIKKKGKMHGIEKIAYQKTKDMLRYIKPLVIFMMDSIEGMTHRDMTLLKEAITVWLPIIFCINKIDLLTDKQTTVEIKKSQESLEWFSFIPVIPISAKEGKGMPMMIKMITRVRQEAQKRVDTHKLTKLVGDDFLQRPPRFSKNKVCKLHYITQVEVMPPTFVAFINHKERANFAFEKWVENSIRRHFWFVGVPLKIQYKERKRNDVEMP